MKELLKDFLVEFLEDEDAEEFQKAENEGKLGEKLGEALKEIKAFQADLPDSFRKAIGVLAQWTFKGYGNSAKKALRRIQSRNRQSATGPLLIWTGKGKKR